MRRATSATLAPRAASASRRRLSDAAGGAGHQRHCSVEVFSHAQDATQRVVEAQAWTATPRSIRSSTPCDAPGRERLPGVGAGLGGRGRGEAGRRTGEARSGSRLADALVLDEHLARRHVRVLRRLAERQDRRDAGVGALEDLGPLGLGARGERLGDQRGAARRAARSRSGRGRTRCRAASRTRRRTAAPADRPTCACRRRSRRGRRTACRRRAGWPPAPRACCRPRGSPELIAFRLAVPSTIAASTTWPSPLSRASRRAASTPMTRYVEPPPKSPTRLLGKCGRSLSWPMPNSAPVIAM